MAAGLGIAMVGAAFGLFKRTGQDPKPWLPTPEIISTDVYRFTRYPMYVSMALLQAALGIGFPNAFQIRLPFPTPEIDSLLPKSKSFQSPMIRQEKVWKFCWP